jgi:regulator of cell morphogenesis and NO signaling
MIIEQSKTVKELALAFPQTTRVFERLGIDYCCGGARALREACQLAGVPVETALRALNEAMRAAPQPGRDWSVEPLTALITHILEGHHVFTRNELDRLPKLFAKVWAAHGEKHPELLLLQSLFEELRAELLQHMLKEEQLLFPYVAQLEQARQQARAAPRPFFGTVRNPVRMMMLEHDNAGATLREMRRLAGDYEAPPDACASFRALYQALAEFEADLHEHIHLENNLLFPRAVALEEEAQCAFA